MLGSNRASGRSMTSRDHRPILTAEDLLAYPGSDDYELVAGVLRVYEPPGGAHGRIATRLASPLDAHVTAGNLGVVLVETGYILRRSPDTVRGPDVSFVSRRHLDPSQVPDGFIPFAPDLAVEIISPWDRLSEIEDTVRDYLDCGARLVWVVDPADRSVSIRRPNR